MGRKIAIRPITSRRCNSPISAPPRWQTEKIEMQETLLRKPQVLAEIGMKSTWLHEAVKLGTFPRPVRLGARAVGWKRSEVEAWKSSREAA